MKLRHILPLLTLVPLPLYAQAPQDTPPAAAPQAQAVVTLPMGDDQLLNVLRSILQADVAGLAEIGTEDVETAQEQAQEAVDECLEALQKSYAAQLAFAEYSLSAIAGTHPQQYAATLTTYRRKLQLAYLQEIALMRSSSEGWISPARRPQLTARRNTFAEALRKRANATSPNMIALRSFHGHAAELAEQQLELKRQYLLRHLSGGFETLPVDREFLSCMPLPDFAPEEYVATRARLFSEAEELWHEYAERAAQLVCPVRSMQGAQDNGSAAAEQLLYSHEEWLTELLAPQN